MPPKAYPNKCGSCSACRGKRKCINPQREQPSFHRRRLLSSTPPAGRNSRKRRNIWRKCVLHTVERLNPPMSVLHTVGRSCRKAHSTLTTAMTTSRVPTHHSLHCLVWFQRITKKFGSTSRTELSEEKNAICIPLDVGQLTPPMSVLHTVGRSCRKADSTLTTAMPDYE